VVDRAGFDDLMRQIDEAIEESERVRARVEGQLRRRAVWPERGGSEAFDAAEEASRDHDPSPPQEEWRSKG
jgi:hypothetical protein